MRVVVSGATGFIGSRIVAALTERGDEVVVLSRAPQKAHERLGVEAVGWDPLTEPAPAEALHGAAGVIHLSGERVAQRWTPSVKQKIRDSRELGTRNLVVGLAAIEADARPQVLVCASATGYYGPRGDEQISEDAAPGDDFLAGVSVTWEHEAAQAAALGLRVCSLRTGMVLDASDGALAKLLPPFKLGLGGPVAGGRQYVPWIHLDDVARMYLHALGDDAWSGAFNMTAPEPVTNAEFTKALGRALHRPEVVPVPGFALRLLYGEMADVITTGQRAVPSAAQAGGFTFAYADIDAALSAAVG